MIEPIKDFPPYLGPVYKIINRIILFLAPFHNIKGGAGIQVKISSRNIVIDATQLRDELTQVVASNSTDLTSINSRLDNIEYALANATAEANLTLDCSQDPPQITGNITIDFPSP